MAGTPRGYPTRKAWGTRPWGRGLQHSGQEAGAPHSRNGAAGGTATGTSEEKTTKVVGRRTGQTQWKRGADRSYKPKSKEQNKESRANDGEAPGKEDRRMVEHGLRKDGEVREGAENQGGEEVGSQHGTPSQSGSVADRATGNNEAHQRH